MKTYYVYILECSDKSYYVGITNNIDRRLDEHNSRLIKGYTSTRLPVRLAYCDTFNEVHDAINCEKKLKRWSRAKKKALIEGNEVSLKILSRSYSKYGRPEISLNDTKGHGSS